MKLRASILAGLLAVTPTVARAEPEAPAVQRVVAHGPVRLDLTPGDAIALTRRHLAASSPAMQEIRLTHGEKTAIIITAIVVGSLVVLGVIVAAQPGHPFH